MINMNERTVRFERSACFSRAMYHHHHHHHHHVTNFLTKQTNKRTIDRWNAARTTSSSSSWHYHYWRSSCVVERCKKILRRGSVPHWYADTLRKWDTITFVALVPSSSSSAVATAAIYRYTCVCIYRWGIVVNVGSRIDEVGRFEKNARSRSVGRRWFWAPVMSQSCVGCDMT